VDVSDDPESPDAAPVGPDGHGSSASSGFDLAPRTSPDGTGTRPASSAGVRKWVALSVLALLVVGLGYVLFQGLNDAATFFYNVDEAVDQRGDLEGDRFRMQGNVVDGSIDETGSGVDFVITYNDVDVPVSHTGTPPELFGTGIPVVIEGTFEGEGFASDEILIRHDNEYDEENPDRIDEAERDAQSLGVSPDVQSAGDGGSAGQDSSGDSGDGGVGDR
jgi:cytochrome c-type biogenesis protein CcmE